MFLLDRRTLLSLTAGTAAAGLLPRRAQAGVGSADVFTADGNGGNVDSVVIVGDEAAVLVDAQLTAPSASLLADQIAATGRRLETVFLTHYHPDHVLGLAVILDRFPDAKPVAHAAVQPKIAETAAAMLDNFNSTAPAGVFADRAIVPEVLGADHILLEGERIDVMEPMHGDTDLITPLYIPALDTLIASDLAYVDAHVWVAENTTADRLDLWRANLGKLEDVGAATVIPGHRAADSVNDASVFAFTRDYLDVWQAALAETSDAESLRATMNEGREGLGLAMAVDRAVAAVYPDS